MKLVMVEVSIIMPSYNSERFIESAIQSVVNQTYENWELIIVDDCSSDRTQENVKKFLWNKKIKIIPLSDNVGPAIARNCAIKEAKGRYIAFLDSDDQWYSEKLEKQLEFMRRENIAFCFSSFEQINEKGKVLRTVNAPNEVTYKQLLKKNVIGCLTAIYDTETLGKVYMPLIRKRQDFGLWLKILKRTEKAFALNEPLAQYRLHEGSISADKRSAAKYTWKLYREVEGLSLPYSCYCFACYALEGLYRSKFSSLLEKRS